VRDKFFKKKREWSRYKDFILRYYLEPYIAKVSTLGKPVLIVDCFAGCGSFEDGEDGSPLIMCKTIQKAGAKAVPIKAEFIEEKKDNYDCLVECLKPYRDFATPCLGTFEENLPALAEKARDHTVFLYVDPYTVKGLIFKRMKAVYDMIRKASASVEVLINLNVATFMRWGLSTLKATRKDDEPLRCSEDDEADYQADDPAEKVELATLDEIAGGGYWRSIALDTETSFPDKLEHFTRYYLQKLTGSFPFTASCEIKSKYEHQVPKYSLVFGTRHPDGVELMNDAMCNARLEFLGNQFSKGWLFDCTPQCEIPDEDKLREDMLALVRKEKSLTRKALRQRLICGPYFGKVVSTSMNRVVTELLKSNQLFSNTGKTRINDEVRLTCEAR
jgi:three-Cys-motif partner protein